MTILSQPGKLLQSAYGRDFEFEVEELAAPGVLVNAVITITNLDTTESITYRVPFVDGATSVWFDPSTIVQTYFCYTANPSIFATIFDDVLVDNTDATFDIEIEIDYEYIDAADDDKYKLTGNIDTTNTYTIFNSVREDTDPATLDEFTVAAAPNRRFFTNRPLCQKICLNENDFLQFWKQADVNAISIIEQSAAGSTSGVLDASALTNGEMATFGSGPEQINDIPAWLTGGVTIDIDTTEYSVQVGFWDGFSFSAVTEAMQYKMQKCCPDIDCRLFWLNRLGGVDGYTFNGTLQVVDDPSSTLYEKPLALPKVVPDYGKGKFNSNDVTVVNLESKRLSEAEAVWLRELQTSIRVCKAKVLNKGDELVQVVVLDTQNVIKDKFANFITRKLTYMEANEQLIQQYG